MNKNGIFEYLTWRGDLDFSRDPFCEVDNLVFSQLSYIDYTDIADGWDVDGAPSLFDVIAEYEMLSPERKYLGAIIPRDTEPLASKASQLQRFKDVQVFGYENIIDEGAESQFCAITFLLPSGEAVVTYRGTDDTLVGWKEDLNMSFLDVTSAQRHALNYLSRVADATGDRDIYVCGHSKGGNLAIYASVNIKKQIRDRIRAVYNNDGPGFSSEFIASSKYRSMLPKMVTFIPQHSIVGMFFERDENHKIVKSTSNTVMSHDLFSWQIRGREIVCVSERTRLTKKGDDAINAWIASLEPKQKKKFVDTLYSALASSGVKTLSDISNNRIKTFTAFGKAMKRLDPDAWLNFRYVLGKMINKNLTIKEMSDTEEKSERESIPDEKNGSGKTE